MSVWSVTLYIPIYPKHVQRYKKPSLLFLGVGWLNSDENMVLFSSGSAILVYFALFCPIISCKTSKNGDSNSIFLDENAPSPFGSSISFTYSNIRPSPRRKSSSGKLILIYTFSVCLNWLFRFQLHQFRNSQMFHSSTKQQSLLVSGSIILACGAYGTKIIYNAYESHQAAKEKEERENPQPKEEAVAGV